MGVRVSGPGQELDREPVIRGRSRIGRMRSLKVYRLGSEVKGEDNER